MHRIDSSRIPIDTIIATTVECLKKGGLVIFPTETTYGAGVDVTNQDAVYKLLAFKSRREGKPLSIAVTSRAMAEQYVELNQQSRTLYQQFLPGPMTVVSNSKGEVAIGVESEFGTLGVRIPDYPLAQQILAAFGGAITATSANASGQARPYKIDKLLENLSLKQRSLIDLVIDAGELPHHPPSTVIDTTLSAPVTLRQGSITPQSSTDQSLNLKTQSEQATEQLAGRLLLKHWDEIKLSGFLIGLNGELGAGKTVFTRGVAKFLQIDDQITSPTYSYMAEYPFNRHGFRGTLHHLDLWKIESAAELSRLKIGKLLHPGSVVVVEWWSQVAQWLRPTIEQSRQVMMLVTITEMDNSKVKIDNIGGGSAVDSGNVLASNRRITIQEL